MMLKTFAVIFLFVFIGMNANAQSASDSVHVIRQIFFQQPTLSLPLAPAVLPQGYYIKHLPFFCDKEYKLEKLTKIPFRFRLGSVEYCDKMEGKNRQ